MIKIATRTLFSCLAIVVSVVAPAAWACDEQCQRQQTETATTKFPSYLSARYCEDLKRDFMTREIKGLHKYREQQLATMHPGGMNNTRKLLSQRQEWLQECDTYMSQTGHGRLFADDKTTDAIFNSISAVESELKSLIGGVTYSVSAGESRSAVAGEKFDRFFKLMDDHQTQMLMKGQVVYR